MLTVFLACFGSGLIELGGAFVVEKLRKVTPRAALLSTLSGIALTFISLGFLFRTYAHPVVGLVTLSVILLVYFGKLRFRGNIPGGLVAVALGALLSWLMELAPVGAMPNNDLGLQLPVSVLGDLLEALMSKHSLSFLSVIIPMGLFNVIGSLQNIESASLLSACGLIHSYQWTAGDTALSLTPAWEWAVAYALMALIFLSAKWICIDG